MLLLGNISFSKEMENKKIREFFPISLLSISQFLLVDVNTKHNKLDNIDIIVEIFCKNIYLIFYKDYIIEIEKYLSLLEKEKIENPLMLSLSYPFFKEDMEKEDRECLNHYTIDLVKIDDFFLTLLKQNRIEKQLLKTIKEQVQDIFIYNQEIVEKNTNLLDISLKDYRQHFLTKSEREILKWV